MNESQRRYEQMMAAEEAPPPKERQPWPEAAKGDPIAWAKDLPRAWGEQCAKCDSDRLTETSRKWRHGEVPAQVYGGDPTRVEWLDVTCLVCGYAWCEKTADAT